MIIFSESTYPQESFDSYPRAFFNNSKPHKEKIIINKSKSGGLYFHWSNGRGRCGVLPPHRLRRMNTRCTCLLPVARRFIFFRSRQTIPSLGHSPPHSRLSTHALPPTDWLTRAYSLKSPHNSAATENRRDPGSSLTSSAMLRPSGGGSSSSLSKRIPRCSGC